MGMGNGEDASAGKTSVTKTTGAVSKAEVPIGGKMRSIVSVVLLGTLPAVSVIDAQQPARVVSSCTGKVVRDSTHPVWTAVESQYLKLAAAMKRKDLDALFALYTADFHVGMPGETWSRERSLEVQRQRMSQVTETKDISNTVLWLS